MSNRRLVYAAFIIAMGVSFSHTTYAQLYQASKSNLPESRQATLLDSSSTSEVLIEASGIYFSDERRTHRKKNDVRKNGVEKASLDAYKAAVYFLLYGGTDPLLSTEEEKQAFTSIQESFFDINNIKSFISFEDDTPSKKVLLEDGTGIKIYKRIKINTDILSKSLENQDIIISKKTLVEALGNPYIMVVPVTPKGTSVEEFLSKDSLAKHGSGVLQGLLTAKQYDVIVPDQQAFLNDLASAQLELENRDEDLAYQLALSVGSDVYIDYTIGIDDSSFGTKKVSATIRAYETTTARLLGAETGYSQSRQGDLHLSAEEALLAAMKNILLRVNKYWKDDLTNGVQYKIVVNIEKNAFDENQTELIQDAVFDAIESMGGKSKEIAVTKHTIDTLVWCDPDKYNRSRKVWRGLRLGYKQADGPGTISMLNNNRKYIIIKVDA